MLCRSNPFFSSPYSLKPLFAQSFDKKLYASIKRTSFAFDLSLYVVADRKSESDVEFFSKVNRLIEGKVSCIQLRDKHADFQTHLKIAFRLKKMLVNTGIPLMINNCNKGWLEVAQTISADGVYLENRETSYSDVRSKLGKISIGLPVNTVEEALKVEKDVDYLSVKVFPSKQTNPDDTKICGIDGLKKIRAASNHYILAIGGITPENLKEVCQALNWSKNHRSGIAMVGPLWRADDPCAMAQKIHEILKRVRNSPRQINH